MDIYGLSHVGAVRHNNEDRFVIRELPFGAVLLAVMDGMGGEASGEYASKIAADALERAEWSCASPARLAELALSANREILAEAARNPELEGMGTTLTAVVARDTTAYWVSVGDSRLYLYRGGVLSQITRDHRFLQAFLDDGEMSAEEAKRHPLRNMLDQCVGSPYCAPDTGAFALREGDVLLLCTDGLNDEVPHGDLATALPLEASARGKTERLLRIALERGGRDNITIVVGVMAPGGE